MSQHNDSGLLDRRRAGVLLHPTSLPGRTLGSDAYRFVDFLSACGMSVWQFLPLGPTHGRFGSPYQCLSVHAGNPQLISAQTLVDQGWLRAADVSRNGDIDATLVAALRQFVSGASAQQRALYDEFRRQHAYWLDDYALFSALRRESGSRHWKDWDPPLRDREPEALAAARIRCASQIDQARFEQFVFFHQWHQLKRYANERNVLLFGDMPIFVAHDSADVWVNRDQFAIDANGELRTMAGVPPDYFSKTGQLWGNPHYDWQTMMVDDFRWWRLRFRGQAEMMDVLRIDHFRGFEAFWEIPAGEKTAMNGRWVQAPGDALFTSIRAHFPRLRIVAEDLGIITAEVEALRVRHGLPGMKILQFAFDSDARNPYLPHNCAVDSVVYTGTHDNDTTVGWFDTLSAEARHRVYDYFGSPPEPMPWLLNRAALASVARLAIIPMQDLLGLDGAHRMNTPGTVENNWRWNYRWDQVDPGLAARVRALVENYGRL
jgi:4-alpha-glucanotransferase